MAKIKLEGTMAVEALKQQFNEAFGSTLKIYNGGQVAADEETLSSLGLKANGDFECRSSLTVGSFIERMMSEWGLKVKVFSCDGWVAILDKLTLESSGSVKKNAVKADMESMIAYQRKDDCQTEAKPSNNFVTAGRVSQLSDLDSLIDMAMEDGKISDQERSVIKKKASTLGLDTDEVDIYINSKIARYAKQRKQQLLDKGTKLAGTGGNLILGLIKKFLYIIIILYMCCLWPFLFIRGYRRVIAKLWSQVTGVKPDEDDEDD